MNMTVLIYHVTLSVGVGKEELDFNKILRDIH